MQFNVAQLLRQPTGATRHYDISEDSEIHDPDLVLLGFIQGSVDLLRTGRGILVKTHLVQHVRVQCVRCLADMDVPITIDLEEEFFPTIDLKTGNPIIWTAEDDVDAAALIDEKHTLDLREVVRQELIVSLPVHSLCRPDCRGICPTCGADLNVEPCQCEAEELDPRWAALAALRDK